MNIELDLKSTWDEFDRKQDQARFLAQGNYTLADLTVDPVMYHAHVNGIVGRKRRREEEKKQHAYQLPVPPKKKPKKRGRKPKNYRRPPPKPEVYNKEQRAKVVEIYRQKRKRRVWTKITRYSVRKNFAAARSRVGGRFIKKKEDPLLQERDRKLAAHKKAEEKRRQEELKAEQERERQLALVEASLPKIMPLPFIPSQDSTSDFSPASSVCASDLDDFALPEYNPPMSPPISASPSCSSFCESPVHEDQLGVLLPVDMTPMGSMDDILDDPFAPIF